MEIHIQVGTHERHLSFELMGNPSSLAPGATVKIGGGAELRYEAETFAKAVSQFPRSSTWYCRWGRT